MPQLTENTFIFESKALPKDTFGVVSFLGKEGVSNIYRFEIQLCPKRFRIVTKSALASSSRRKYPISNS